MATTTFAFRIEHDAEQEVYAVLDADGDVHDEFPTRELARAELARLFDEKIADELRDDISARLPDLDLATLCKIAALL